MKGVTFLLKMEFQKCKGLDLMAEPPCIKVCWVLTAPLQGRGCRAKKKWHETFSNLVTAVMVTKWSNWSIEWTAESSLKIQYTFTYYSFKIFLHFLLAKIPWIIHHNQPLRLAHKLSFWASSTAPCERLWESLPATLNKINLEEVCHMWKMTSILQHNNC